MQVSRIGWVAVAALAMAVAVSQVALAQQEGRRGGRGGRDGGFGGGGGMMSGAQLVTLEPVQAALKLTDEQKDKIKDINEQMRADRSKLFEGGRDQGGDRTAMREKMQELNATAAKKLNEVLDEGQQKRLMGIQIQFVGAAALMDPAIEKELNITHDQKKKLEEASESNRQAMREAFEGGQGQGGREAREKLRDEANKKLMAVLTSDQQAQFESLKGEKIEIDRSALRGPGGRFGGQQRGERGNRNRGDRNPESNNQN